MAATLGRIVWGNVIATTEQKIDVDEDGGGGAGVFIATITAGTYLTPELLAAEVKTQLEAGGSGTYTVTVSADGKFTIAGSIDFALDWSGAANSATYVLGWEGSDVASGASHTAPNQHHAGFYFGETGPDLEVDSEETPEANAPQSVSMGGTVTQYPTGAIRYSREMKISFMDRARAWESTNNEKSAEDMFNYLMGAASRYITYAPDASSISETSYYVVPSDGAMHTYKPIRLDPSVELWAFGLLLRKKV